jgi:hypothetical protein
MTEKTPAVDVHLQTARHMTRFLTADPARTMGPRSAFSAILSSAIDPFAAFVYLRHLVNDRMSTEDFEESLFALAVQDNAYAIGVEVTGGDDLWKTKLINGARMRGININWVWLSPHSTHVAIDGDFGTGRDAVKRRRAAGVSRLYRPYLPSHPNGHVIHSEAIKGSALEGQMMTYPSIGICDALDCLGYIPQMMEELGISFREQVRDAKTGERRSDVNRKKWDRGIEERLWSADYAPAY